MTNTDPCFSAQAERFMRALCPLPIILTLSLLAAVQDITAEERDLSFRDIATGVWGFDVKGASCDDNPHTIEFSADGHSMALQYSKDVSGGPPPVTKYLISGEGPGFMRMAMEGETRTTDEGEIVQWDMVLLSPDSYCWHRTDWQEGGCTQPAHRCLKEGAEP